MQTFNFSTFTIEQLETFIANQRHFIEVETIMGRRDMTPYMERVLKAESELEARLVPAALATEAAPVEAIEVSAETKVEVATRRMVREFYPVRFGANVPTGVQVNPAIFACFLAEAGAPAMPSRVIEAPSLKRDADAQTVVGLARSVFDSAAPIPVADLLRLFRVAVDLASVPSIPSLESMADALGITIGVKMLRAIREELVLARMTRRRVAA